MRKVVWSRKCTKSGFLLIVQHTHKANIHNKHSPFVSLCTIFRCQTLPFCLPSTYLLLASSTFLLFNPLPPSLCPMPFHSLSIYVTLSLLPCPSLFSLFPFPPYHLSLSHTLSSPSPSSHPPFHTHRYRLICPRPVYHQTVVHYNCPGVSKVLHRTVTWHCLLEQHLRMINTLIDDCNITKRWLPCVGALWDIIQLFTLFFEYGKHVLGGQAHITYRDEVEVYAEVMNEHYAMYTVR